MDYKQPSSTGNAVASVAAPVQFESRNGRNKTSTPATDIAAKINVQDLSFYYGSNQALTDVTMKIPPRNVTALIGPSGCGKSTFLRCINRMNDLIEETRIEGTLQIENQDIYAPQTDVVELRKRVGMVFQKSNPFPKSIFENVAYGPRVAGMRNRATLKEIVESSLSQAALWDEVKDRLDASAANSPADNNSDSVSHGHWRPIPKCC